MPGFDHIANIIQFGGCVVMGIGVTPERFRLLLQDATNQDYLVIGPKDSEDTKFIAFRMSGEQLKPRSIVISALEIDAYLVRSGGRAG